ncbi:DUF1330 domain-containing protein [Ascidiaceihabitans sp.]|uniref:DUF1330 domain-containing protein n=1 Tax=Ascidiaceihabitans sp. TaxID=1872644 RepID=UPI003298C51B
MDHHIDPNRAQFDAFKDLPRDQPIEMLNLVKFKTHAEYPADHPMHGQNLSGADAYKSYGSQTGPILQKVGGTILWRGRFESVLIGPDDETWDACFIARYPNSGAFLAMVTDPDYQKAVVHRQAAVLTSRLIRHGTTKEGDAFG